MIRGLVFDLDGTLTAPGQIDFAAIRREIGCPPGLNILAHLAQLERTSASAHARACETLDRYELRSAEEAAPARHLTELLEWLRQSGQQAAILTRNSRRATELTLRKLALHGFSPVICREDARPKPAPDGILLALARWKIPPEAALMIGDYLHDLEAGVAAGVRTVQVAEGPPIQYAVAPDFVVHDLLELPGLLERLGDT